MGETRRANLPQTGGIDFPHQIKYNPLLFPSQLDGRLANRHGR